MPLCPLECNRTEYRTSLYSVQLIGDKYVEAIKANKNLTSDFVTRELNVQSARESIVKLNIYYDSLSYQLSTESVKFDIVALLSSVGGNLSLFLGVGVFSVCEIVEVLLEVYFIRKTQFIK